MTDFPFFKYKAPQISVKQMIKVDRLMIEKYKISLLQMMENTGRSLAMLAKERFLDGDPVKKLVYVMCGNGGNGGAALVCARRLHGWGARVCVFTMGDHLRDDTKKQLESIEQLNIDVKKWNGDVNDVWIPDLVIDGIIGYSILGNPSGAAEEMIAYVNNSGAQVLSLDNPSGVDLDTGYIHKPCIKAEATMTLALPKKILFQESVKEKRGELYLADIGVPLELYEEEGLGLTMPYLFAQSDIIRLE